MGLNSDNYVVIQGWMCSELKLKGNDLLVYALIYGFSQDGESVFQGSRKYIAETFNISLPTVDKTLKGLVDKGYIEKIVEVKNGVIFNHYKTLQGVKKLYCPGKETLHNNTNNKYSTSSNIVSKDTINTTTKSQQFEFGKPKPKKQTLYSKCLGLINDFTDDIELRKLLVSWFNMLLEKYRDRGKQLYLNVFKGKLNMLMKFPKNDWLEIVEYNLQKGYEGFYPIKQQQYKKSVVSSFENMEPINAMTREDYEELDRITEERRKNGLRTSF